MPWPRRECTSLLAVVLGALAMVGCGGPGAGLAPGTYERGYEEFEGGHHLEAIEDLKLFIRRNPTDDRADDAQFWVGRAYMEMKDYPVAAVEFEILRADYPNSELLEEAFYQEAHCYLAQVPGTELEQSSTTQAISHLRRYLRDFPQGPHREEMENELSRLRRHLDEKEMDAARLYLRMGRHEAARVTMQAAMEEHPDSPLRPDMLLLAAEASRRLDDRESERRFLEEILREYPDHEAAAKARRRLEGRRARLEDDEEEE